jgi:hypothetical protein
MFECVASEGIFFLIPNTWLSYLPFHVLTLIILENCFSFKEISEFWFWF